MRFSLLLIGSLLFGHAHDASHGALAVSEPDEMNLFDEKGRPSSVRGRKDPEQSAAQNGIVAQFLSYCQSWISESPKETPPLLDSADMPVVPAYLSAAMASEIRELSSLSNVATTRSLQSESKPDPRSSKTLFPTATPSMEPTALMLEIEPVNLQCPASSYCAAAGMNLMHRFCVTACVPNDRVRRKILAGWSCGRC
jgi:putative hemolysin